MKLLFFWDYDTQWGAERSRSGGGAKDWGPLEFENTERLITLHEQYDIPACFAVVGAAALPGQRPYHDPDQIRRLHQAGHEIASHSFHHDWLPGLNRKALLETLRRSKDALEQCIGAPVTSFVPPYNQPFDYPRGWSWSLSERREAGTDRTGLRGLCEALKETGYRFARVAYRPWTQRVRERLKGRRLDQPAQLETIEGITCLRLNTPGGFHETVQRCLQEHLDAPGYWLVYGHPHSLSRPGNQCEAYLRALMTQVAEWKHSGSVEILRPQELTEDHLPPFAAPEARSELQST